MALQFILDRLTALDVIAWQRHARIIHVVAGPRAALVRGVLTAGAGLGRRVTEAIRGSVRRRSARVAGARLQVAQSAVSAAAAWAAATLVFGHRQPFFAPVAAVISLGVARGQPRRRAVELVVGVATGIAVADLLSRLIGTGVVQIGAVVALAMASALLLGAGTILVNQAAVSAILVMTLPGAVQGAVPERFVDALIGAAVGLLIGQVLLPRNPITQVAAAAGRVLERVASGLDLVADALAVRGPRAGRAGPARAALARRAPDGVLRRARRSPGDGLALAAAPACTRSPARLRRRRRPGRPGAAQQPRARRGRRSARSAGPKASATPSSSTRSGRSPRPCAS